MKFGQQNCRKFLSFFCHCAHKLDISLDGILSTQIYDDKVSRNSSSIFNYEQLQE
jgi:hypothetical protein